MLVDVFVHSASAALHYELGSGQLGSGSAAAVHVTQPSHSQSVLAPTSVHATVEP